LCDDGHGELLCRSRAAPWGRGRGGWVKRRGGFTYFQQNIIDINPNSIK
jgi:hypothetical protein